MKPAICGHYKMYQNLTVKAGGFLAESLNKHQIQKIGLKIVFKKKHGVAYGRTEKEPKRKDWCLPNRMSLGLGFTGHYWTHGLCSEKKMLTHFYHSCPLAAAVLNQPLSVNLTLARSTCRCTPLPWNGKVEASLSDFQCTPPSLHTYISSLWNTLKRKPLFFKFSWNFGST